MIENTVKIFWGFLGAVFAYMQPTIPFVLICTLGVMYDCLIREVSFHV